MNARYDLSRHRRARVWLDDAPEASYEPARVARRVVCTGPAAPPALRRAAVEVRIPMGGMCGYGLLGAELVDTGAIDGHVSVAIGQTDRPMPEHISLASTVVLVGLPEEFANGVLRGVELAVDRGGRFAGELAFRWAAHDLVGSSFIMFAHVAGMVTQLLTRTTVPSESEMLPLLDQPLPHSLRS